jgi:transmembrane sensor
MVDESGALKALGRVREHVTPELDHGTVERIIAGAAGRRDRRRLRKSLGLGLAIGAVSATVLWLFVRVAWFGGAAAGVPVKNAELAGGAASVAAPVVSGAPQLPKTWALSDQSRATALDPATRIVIEEDAPRQAQVRLERGRARFEVAHRPERSFQVHAGSVTVRVIGTVFAVEVVADRIGVAVEQGSVEVDWGVGNKRLFAGEQGWYPPLVLSGGELAATASAPVPAVPVAAASEATAATAPSVSSRPEATSARELLAESDAARTRGELARGAELLRRVLREHPNDARAPLAAFTLGRLLLNELGRPREAANAFHEVQLKAPGGQLAEDALAREVESWKQAAEPARARALAQKYLARYPSGRHVVRVKALAGIE